MKRVMTITITLAAVVALLGAGFVGYKHFSAPTMTAKQIDALSDEDSIALGNCQTAKVVEDLGEVKAKQYFDKIVDDTVADVEADRNIVSVQKEMAADGYVCDEQERNAYITGGSNASESASKGNGFSKWDADQAAAASASSASSASATASASASATADTSWTAEEDAIKGAAAYYEAAAAGDWDTTYYLLDGQTQMAFTLSEWHTANNNLGVGSYEILSATQASTPNDFTVEVLVNGTETRYTTFTLGSDGTFYHQLTPEEIDMFVGAIY